MSKRIDIDASRAALDAAGVTLSELLVSCALSGMVLAGTYVLLDQGLRAYAAGAARVESLQAARAALERVARELRLAGRGPSAEIPALLVAEPARVMVTADLDADGDNDASGERVTWQLVDSILRRNAGAGAQPVANGVRGLNLRYFDAADQPTTDPAAVRSVEVTVQTAPVDGRSPGVGTSLHTRVRLRNR